MIAVRADSSVMRSRVQSMRGRVPSSRQAALMQMSDLAGDAFSRISPRDTNRYLRAWLEAVGEAGGSPRPLPALQAGRGGRYIKERLTRQWLQQHRQVLRMQKWLDGWCPPGTKEWPFIRKKRAQLEKMKKREERLKQELDTLAKSPTDAVILIGARGKKGFATVRTTVYGGHGFIDIGAGVLYLRNLEPHAQIVEARQRTKMIVGRYLKMVGVRVVTSAMATRLIAGRRGLSMKGAT